MLNRYLHIPQGIPMVKQKSEVPQLKHLRKDSRIELELEQRKTEEQSLQLFKPSSSIHSSEGGGKVTINAFAPLDAAYRSFHASKAVIKVQKCEPASSLSHMSAAQEKELDDFLLDNNQEEDNRPP